MADVPDLRDYVRVEPSVPQTLLVRGGPDTATKLRAHAERMHRAYVLDGAPVRGVSVFAALDELGPASLDGLQKGRLSTYRVLHLASMDSLAAAGFGILPTFGRPHMTILLDSLDHADRLAELIGAPQPNPGYGEKRLRKR